MIDTYKLIVKCRNCGKYFPMLVTIEDFNKWQEGALIQDAFPYLTDSQRELLLSGLCGDCWRELWQD